MMNQEKIEIINFLQDFGCAKLKGRFKQFYKGFYPIYITFLSNDNLLYHIIVADNENKKGIVKLINSHSFTLPNADKLILAFPDNSEFENIKCNLKFQ